MNKYAKACVIKDGKEIELKHMDIITCFVVYDEVSGVGINILAKLQDGVIWQFATINKTIKWFEVSYAQKFMRSVEK